MKDGAIESTATPPPGSSRERQPAVTGDQAVPEPEPACGADLDRDEVAALRAILEGTARSTGAVFFQTLVRHLASALGVSFAFVAEFAGAPTRVRTLAYWGRGRIQQNLEFELAGTPCEDVVRGGLCHHPQEVRERFPGDRLLVDLGIESYLGVPLLDGDGRVLGHLAVFDERPMPPSPGGSSSSGSSPRGPPSSSSGCGSSSNSWRASGAIASSTRRHPTPTWRSAAIDGSSASITAPPNCSACRRPSWWAGPCWRTVAETPAGRPQAEEALCAGFAGREISGRELEMRRRDGSAAVGQCVDEAAPRG